MRYKLHFFFVAFALTLAPLASNSHAVDVKTAYAMSDNADLGKGIYTFELSDTIKNISLFQALNVDAVSSGYLLGDTYYYLEYSQVYNGYKTLGFYAFDMESKTVRQIADYGGVLNGTIAGHFTYDYQTGTMYGLDFFNGGSNLVKIDLENGNISTVCQLTFDALNDAAQASGAKAEGIHVMASNYDGDFYGVSYWGALYKINQYTGLCQYIGTLDYNPGQAFMYTGDDLFFDDDNGRLFMRFTTYDWSTSTWLYETVEIDTKTAHVTRFAEMPPLLGLHAVSVPFTVAEASAPAKVQNLTMTRGAAGTLTATLEWDNPTKTYGRGGTLEELDYVLIYRDGILMDSIANPAIGGHQVWTDNKLEERGYYIYKVVCGNSMGRGDRTSAGAYIGEGDPMAVAELDVEASGDGAVVKWVAPTEGKLNSYINTDALRYDVFRYKNRESTPVKVADGVKVTSFTDNTISEMAKYKYAVIARTQRYESDSIWTGAVVAGPAYVVPCAIGFADLDQFNLWNIIDANGNYSSWSFQDGQQGGTKGAYCTYNYDEMPAADWLISPRVRLEAGKRYKMTFDATPGNRKVIETIAVTLGQGSEIARQDSINQFDILSDETVKLRANLPLLSSDGDYNLGLYYRSYMSANYNLTVDNVIIAEDHEGYISGTVKCGGKYISGATVYADGGEFTATTDEKGFYKLDYLPEGDHTVHVRMLGYEDKSDIASVTEHNTTSLSFNLTALDRFTVSATVKDVAGDPVAGAEVSLSGYDTKETFTDSDGRFSIADVYRSGNYSVTVSKNKLLAATKNFGVESDTDLGTMILEDNIKPAQKVKVTENASVTAVTWNAPANDAVVQRIDDGTLTTAVGISNATSNTMFGVVKREPSVVSGAQFYIDGTSSIIHYSVVLTIFDLDENGEPTPNILYQNTYVPAADGQWSSYTLPAPVDAPNGYYLALSYYDYLLVGIDGAGDSGRYPFVERTNCFTSDYTTGNYMYLDDQPNEAYHHNFLIRPIAAPMSVPEDVTELKSGKRNVFRRHVEENAPQVELMSKQYDGNKIVNYDEPVMKRTVQDRIRYNVYRMSAADVNNESNWMIVSERQKERNFTDNNWESLAQGSYVYAVKAIYTGDKASEAALSDSIGNKMSTTVRFHITTNTPDNEAYGAKVLMADSGGRHTAEGVADDNGDVVIEDVWKTKYAVTVSLDGFKTTTGDVDVSRDDDYSFSYRIDEDRVRPYNLYVENGVSADSKRFAWNYPDVFFDDFESHDDFALNSSGNIGWQYIDGDEAETGAIYYYTWEGIGQPMAYMVFNAKATTPAVYGQGFNLEAYSGDKCLQDWAAYNVPNDDWLITPQLHFQKDFRFSFYAAGMDASFPETFEVLYSTTDAHPESFVPVGDPQQTQGYYTKYSFDIPKEAKYVALHCISDQQRVFRVDDVMFGLPEEMEVPYCLSRNVRGNMMKSPSLDGLYEVYLDGKKVAQQDDTEYVFCNLAEGKHTAGVIASYTSGKTEMSTIDFVVDSSSGITAVDGSGLKVTVSGKVVTVGGNYDDIRVFSVDGTECPLARTAVDSYRICGKSGVYIVNVYAGGQVETFKTTVR